MALRVAHILAIFAESGVILSIHDTHMGRDSSYDHALLLWKVTCGRKGQPAPIDRLDILVPLECDDTMVMRGVEQMMRRRATMDAMIDMAVDILMDKITKA
jgi:hypothetical protein